MIFFSLPLRIRYTVTARGERRQPSVTRKSNKREIKEMEFCRFQSLVIFKHDYYLNDWVGGIIKHLDDDPIGRPWEATSSSNGELIHLLTSKIQTHKNGTINISTYLHPSIESQTRKTTKKNYKKKKKKLRRKKEVGGDKPLFRCTWGFGQEALGN